MNGLFGGEGAVMIATLNEVNSNNVKKPEVSSEETAAKEMERMAKEMGLSLTGPDGLLKQFTKSVLETAPEKQLTENLGTRNTRPLIVARPLTCVTGQDENGPDRSGRSCRDRFAQDRDGTFRPQIVKKRQRRLTGLGEVVRIALCQGVDDQ